MTARGSRIFLVLRAVMIAAGLSAAVAPRPAQANQAPALTDLGAASQCATKKKKSGKAKKATKKAAKPKPSSATGSGTDAERVAMESVVPRPRPTPGANPPDPGGFPEPSAPRPETAPPPAQTLAGEPGGAFTPARMDPANPNRQPDYPLESRSLGEQGRVVLWVEILADGSVGRVLVATSSLAPRLDAAALAAARTWRYIPAMRGGVPVTSGANVMVDFKLTN